MAYPATVFSKKEEVEIYFQHLPKDASLGLIPAVNAEHTKILLQQGPHFGGMHAEGGGSGITKLWDENHKKAIMENPKKRGTLVRVETETLSEIMNKFDFPEYIHLLDIDVEYADYDVLIGCDWEKHRFGAILVELNNELVEKKMKKEGYNMYLQFKEGSKDRLYIDSKNKKLEEKVKKINKTIRDEKGRIVHWEIGVLQK